MKTEFLDAIIRQPSITALARRSGVHTNTIRSWLFCGVEPTLANAEKVARVMDKEIVLVDKKEVN